MTKIGSVAFQEGEDTFLEFLKIPPFMPDFKWQSLKDNFHKHFC
jgi:hypothetical protein